MSYTVIKSQCVILPWFFFLGQDFEILVITLFTIQHFIYSHCRIYKWVFSFIWVFFSLCFCWWKYLELVKYLNIYYYPNVCGLSPAHTKKLLKRIPQTHIRRQTVIDVHEVLATSAIDSKSRVWSITCPSSHGVGLESSIVVLWYCPSHALCMGKFLIGPTALHTFSHGAPPQDTFWNYERKNGTEWTNNVQCILYTVIKFHVPESIVHSRCSVSPMIDRSSAPKPRNFNYPIH